MDAALKKELRERAAEDDRLYDQFGASLETTHRGQYVAIGKTGEFLVGPDDIAVWTKLSPSLAAGTSPFEGLETGLSAVGDREVITSCKMMRDSGATPSRPHPPTSPLAHVV